MSLLKELGEKAKQTAKMVGEKSSDLMETGKVKLQISQLESEIKKLKGDLGQLYYDAFSLETEMNADAAKALCEEIKGKFEEIDKLKEELQDD